MKSVALFLAGFLAGAVFCYGFMWYQVYLKFDATWCQIQTGNISLERKQHCDNLVKQPE